MRAYTAGGHNLHDEDGRVEVWADAMFWTEAIPSRIRDRVRLARTRLVWDDRDTTMVLGLNRALFKLESAEWHRAHAGVGKVTPHRGTLMVRYRSRGRDPIRFGSLLSHRINGSEAGHLPPMPYVDGEARLRADLYRTHWRLDAELDEILRSEDRQRLHGGDYNRHGGSVFPVTARLTERGNNPDRVAASNGLRLGPMQWLPKQGSDHPGWRVDVTPR